LHRAWLPWQCMNVEPSNVYHPVILNMPILVGPSIASNMVLRYLHGWLHRAGMLALICRQGTANHKPTHSTLLSEEDTKFSVNFKGRERSDKSFLLKYHSPAPSVSAVLREIWVFRDTACCLVRYWNHVSISLTHKAASFIGSKQGGLVCSN
jgi:hypothetical protein